MKPGYKKRGWTAIALSLVTLAAAVAVMANAAQPERGFLFLFPASIMFIVGLVLFAHGKGYSALTIITLLIVPTLIAELLPWHSHGGVGGLITVLLIALLPDRAAANGPSATIAGATWRDNAEVTLRMVAERFKRKS